MKIKAGKYYQLRDGTIVGPVTYNSDVEYPIKGSGLVWTKGGNFLYSRALHEWDIVSKVKNPNKSPKIEQRLYWGAKDVNPNTHVITFDIVAEKVDCSSVKMEIIQ